MSEASVTTPTFHQLSVTSNLKFTNFYRSPAVQTTIGALVDAKHPTTGQWLKSKICGSDEEMDKLVTERAFTREEVKPTGRVKVHYIGWAARHDVWYEKGQQGVDIVPPGNETGRDAVHPSVSFKATFHLTRCRRPFSPAPSLSHFP